MSNERCPENYQEETYVVKWGHSPKDNEYGRKHLNVFGPHQWVYVRAWQDHFGAYGWQDVSQWYCNFCRKYDKIVVTHSNPMLADDELPPPMRFDQCPPAQATQE